MDSEETEPEIIDLTTLKDTPILNTRDRQMSVQLTQDEWEEFVDLQISAIIETTTLEATEKARRSVWNGQHKHRESEVQRLVGIVDARAEDRQVEVIDYALLDGPPDSNAVLTVRTDTGEVLGRRALRGPELDKLSQQGLPLSDASDAAEPAVESVTIKGVTFADPMGALAFINTAERLSMEVVGLKGRPLKFILERRPFDSLQDLADVRGIGTKALEAIQKGAKAAELPPEAGESKPAKSL